MTFVIEEIPEQERKKLIDSTEGYNQKLSSKWVVDRGNNSYIILISKVGGPYEGTQITKYFSLKWNDKVIKFSADPLKETFSEDGAAMNWRVHELSIPEELRNQQENILRLIAEGFNAIGGAFNGYRYLNVNVEFDLGTSS